MDNNLIALLLSAGDSTRFWPLSDKNNFNIFGKSVIYHSLNQLVKHGISQFAISANSNNIDLFSHLQSEFPNVKIDLVLQKDPRGMAGAIVSAKKYIQGKKLLIISPSDIVEEIIFSQMLNLVKTSPDGVISGVTQVDYFPGAYLTMKNNKIKSIVEKPSPIKKPSDIIAFVFDYFADSNVLLTEIENVKTTRYDHFEKAIDSLIKKGYVFRFLHYKGYWGYLKFPWQVLSVISYFLGKLNNYQSKSVTVADSAVIEGKVHLEDNIKIMENAKIIGPTYIGKNTVIGNNCLIRESVIGSNCMVGFSTEIARSHIGDNCWFHKNYIGDSVIDRNVSMGAGAVLANFRLDEKSIKTAIINKIVDTKRLKLGAIIGANVRIGVNSSIMPGIKIGRNTFVASGTVVDRDVPDNIFCTLKTGKIVFQKNKINLRE